MTVLRLYDFAAGPQGRLLHELETAAPFARGDLLVDEHSRYWVMMHHQPDWPHTVNYRRADVVAISTKGRMQ